MFIDNVLVNVLQLNNIDNMADNGLVLLKSFMQLRFCTWKKQVLTVLNIHASQLARYYQLVVRTSRNTMIVVLFDK